LSVKSLQAVKERLKQRPEELRKAKEAGAKIIGWCGYNVPEEIIYALGYVPLRLAIGGDDRLVEIGSRYISTKNCVFTREIIGFIEQNTDPFLQSVDAFVFDSTCIQMYRVAELVEFFFHKKVFILGVPRHFDWHEGEEYFAKEAEDFTRKLAELTDTTLDLQKLSEAVELYNGIRKTLKEIYEYQAGIRNAITWEEVFDLIHAGYYLDRREYLGLLKQVLEELRASQAKILIDKDDGDARIFISGSVIPPGDRKLIELITSVGGRIVGDDVWTGILPYLDVHIRESTVRGVVLAYLKRTPHAALPYMDLDTDKRVKKLGELIESYQADGVIYYSLRYCDPFTFKAKETKDILAKKNIPFLEIHTEYAGSDYEAIKTRIEAFVELLDCRKLVLSE